MTASSRKIDGREDRFWYEERGRYLRSTERGKKDKLVNRRDAPPQPGAEGSRGKNNHARRRAQFGARNLHRKGTSSYKRASGYSYASRAFNASTCALRVVSVPLYPRGTGDNCVLRQGKGISAYMRHNTICDAPCVHHARPRGICARQRARLPCALRRIAVRRLMENALLPLNAVLRLPTIQSHLSTYGTARVEDLTRVFSRAHEDSNATITARIFWYHTARLQSITEASFTRNSIYILYIFWWF